ncbi:hypothetical protein DPMN_015340 [Dreissena polymorpha]|uniref:Uncharacterized protein n=1 Tax=Dreissena polymorpha TaxID=45954 RepID=A0A9D4N7K3_DREPO|nr:hypothetical protein DPMN_015340 [Dreissena polymorpha]
MQRLGILHEGKHSGCHRERRHPTGHDVQAVHSRRRLPRTGVYPQEPNPLPWKHEELQLRHRQPLGVQADGLRCSEDQT